MALTNAYCKGLGKKFKEIPCEFYNPLNACRLLKENINDIFDKCRILPLEIIVRVISKCAKTLREWYQVDVDDREDLDFKKILEKLKNIKALNAHTLEIWYGYIRRTVYCEMKENLDKVGLLPRRRVCGNCKYLTEFFPYHCQLKEIRYSGQERVPNPNYGQKKRKTDPACTGQRDEGYKPKIPIVKSANDNYGHSEEGDSTANKEKTMLDTLDRSEPERGHIGQDIEKTIQKLDIEKIRAALRIRAEEAEGVKKKMYIRQARIYNCLYDQLFDMSENDDISEGYIKEKISKVIGVDKKTIERDIEEIRAFLEN